MKLRIYEYKNCGTCRNALKFLAARRVACERIAIREHPPTKAELKRMLAAQGGDMRKLFNTSGGDYKALKLAGRLPTLSVDAALDLLAGNGNLVKRPFVIGENCALVGFKEAAWSRIFGDAK